MKTKIQDTTRQAIIYCRVSSPRQEEEGTSLDSQEDACRAYAADHGYAVGRVTREIYPGNELWDRPKLAQDRADLKAGKFQALIVHGIDRLTRDHIHLGVIVEECDRAGVELQFVLEPLDSSLEGQIIQAIRGIAAKIEREKHRERVMRGRRKRVLDGKVPGAGFDLYGYRRDNEAGIRTICEPEATVIRDIFRWIGIEGLGISAVVRRLNERGIAPPSKGKVRFSDGERVARWGTGTLGRIIRQSAYVGEAYAWRYKVRRDKGRAVGGTPRPREEWIRLPDHTTPAIITPDLWNVVQQRLDTNRGEWTRNMSKARQYLLRGLIVCAACGRPMYPEPNRDIRVYRCSSRRSPEGKCGGSSVIANWIEVQVWEKIANILKNPQIIADEVRRRQNEGPDPVMSSDLATARRKIAKIEKQQAGLGARLRDAADDPTLWDLLRTEIAKMDREKAELETMITELEGRLGAQQQLIDRLEALSTYCERVQRNLDSFGFEEQRLALEALAALVTVNGREWRIDATVPTGGADGVISQPN